MYQKMDVLYQGKMYFPGKVETEAGPTGPRTPASAHGPSLTSLLPPPPSGYFPNELRNIFREQVRLIQNAIIESEQTRAGGPRAIGGFESPSRLGAPARARRG